MKKIIEKSSYNGEKNEQSNYSLVTNNIIKSEKYLVNNKAKFQKTAEKNLAQRPKKLGLKKQSDTTILSKNSGKNEKFETCERNFLKKNNCKFEFECYGTKFKNQKISEKIEIDSEKSKKIKSVEIALLKL